MSISKPADCKCGCKSVVHHGTRGFWVQCTNYIQGCWKGPIHMTRDMAVYFWNALMENKNA